MLVSILFIPACGLVKVKTKTILFNFTQKTIQIKISFYCLVTPIADAFRGPLLIKFSMTGSNILATHSNSAWENLLTAHNKSNIALSFNKHSTTNVVKYITAHQSPPQCVEYASLSLLMSSQYQNCKFGISHMQTHAHAHINTHTHTNTYQS